MRIGVDGRKIAGADRSTPVEILEHAKELGMEGVYYRTLLDITPTLDLGVLREVRQRADELGLYLQMGLAKVNPYSALEAPEVREIGDGDYTRGFVKMLHAAREGADCGELWVACCNYKKQYPGYYAIDRFRSEAPWPDQLAAIEKFLAAIAPVARDLDCHLNMETHEEITSGEVVRLVESIGPDVMGITDDTANALGRGESPVEATERVAPYVRATHLRDSVLVPHEKGLARVFAAPGDGIIDWVTVMGILYDASPDLNASIEPAGATLTIPIGLHDSAWRELHPDLVENEVDELFRLEAEHRARAERGEVPTVEQLRAATFDGDAFVIRSAEYLREALRQATGVIRTSVA